LSGGVYSAYVEVENQNLDLVADNIGYNFRFYNSKNEEVYSSKGNFYLLLGEKKFVVLPKFVSTESVTFGKFELSSDGSMNITVYNDADHGRQEISLFSSLTSLVKRHLHIGGNDNPSPIDLSQHVTGVLSAEHIGDIDLSKVTSGTLDPNRLPQIDHNSLLNIGTLTHAQIDALLAALQYPDNNYRLSDYGIVNRLQIILALKKQSGFLNIDGEQLNSIFYLPYTQLSNFVDNNNTTATIDTGIHRVYGVAGIPRQSNIIKINTTQDFKTALFYAEDSIIFPEVDNLEVTEITCPSDSLNEIGNRANRAWSPAFWM
jgi:hypothetical protein